MRQIASLLDHFVGVAEQCRRHRQTNRDQSSFHRSPLGGQYGKGAHSIKLLATVLPSLGSRDADAHIDHSIGIAGP
jgi:hypothetical protein